MRVNVVAAHMACRAAHGEDEDCVSLARVPGGRGSFPGSPQSLQGIHSLLHAGAPLPEGLNLHTSRAVTGALAFACQGWICQGLLLGVITA